MRLLRTLGIVVAPVLLGTAFTAVVVSLPARAATHSWQDTALSASAVTDETFGGTNIKFTGGTNVIYLSGNDVTWSLPFGFSGVSVTNTTPGSATMSYSGSNTGDNSSIFVAATDSNGNAEAFEMQMYLAPDSIGFNGHTTLLTVSDLADTNSNGTVEFSAQSNGGIGPPNAVSFSESNLPTGLTGPVAPLTYSGMTAAPGAYSGVVVTAKNDYGAVLKGTFTLTVSAKSINTYGNYVNKYGDGFDVFRHKAFPGAKIVSWTATRSDPGTHFIINVGTHPGAYQIEYAPNGTGSGLCVSDPGGGVSSDPLRDGLILVHCGSGNWQQFIRLSNGALKNWATGLYVNPGGAGAQLRGERSARIGSSYTWRAESSLP